MKKYINPKPIPNGGMPIYGGDFVECLQTEVYRAIIAGYKAYNEPVIVNGCMVVADLVNNTCTVSTGMAFIDGDLIDVPAYAGAFPVYLKQGVATQISKNYKDQEPRVVMVQKTSVWVAGVPGAGDYIKFDPYTSQYLKDVQRRFLTPLNRCEWFPELPADAFDVTGMGKWEWLGYCIANSNNDTADLTGRVPAQFNPGDPDMAIGNPFGSKNVALIGTQNGPHTHRMNGAAYYTKAGGTEHPAGNGGPGGMFETTSSGTGAPHNNMQPTLFGVWLQRR